MHAVRAWARCRPVPVAQQVMMIMNYHPKILFSRSSIFFSSLFLPQNALKLAKFPGGAFLKVKGCRAATFPNKYVKYSPAAGLW